MQRLFASLVGVLVLGVGVARCGGDSSDSDNDEPSAGEGGDDSQGGVGGKAMGGSTSNGGTAGTSGKGGAGGAGGTRAQGGTAGAGTPGGEAGMGGANDAGEGGAAGAGGTEPSCTPGAASGTRLSLQSATATLSQTVFGNFSIALSIDGVVNDGLGWAVDSGSTVVAQTAAFETGTDTPDYANGTRITFVLVQNHEPEHALGHFRFSVTTADRADFADGNTGSATPGNVGASGIWTVLAPVAFCGLGDVFMRDPGDGSVLVSENDIVPTVYSVIFETPLTGLTGVRLEALEDPSLPFDGPGLADPNGNFVLTELEAYIEAL